MDGHLSAQVAVVHYALLSHFFRLLKVAANTSTTTPQIAATTYMLFTGATDVLFATYCSMSAFLRFHSLQLRDVATSRSCSEAGAWPAIPISILHQNSLKEMCTWRFIRVVTVPFSGVR